ncbi:MAG: hypothetical protein K6U75_12735 [Firmicutes bacterium]|nr:hypothetical protein [Bacillota bacterium]
MAMHSLKVCVPETDYLQAERQEPTKREYLAGEVRALAGASEPHHIIVLLVQDRMHAEHYVRQPDGQWSRTAYDHPKQSVVLHSAAVALPRWAIYEGISLSQEA